MQVTTFLGLSLKRLAGRLLKKKVVVPPLQIPQTTTVIEEMETETERRLNEVVENARLDAVLDNKIAEAQGDIDEQRKWAAMMVYLPTVGKMRTFSESQRLKMFHRHLAAVGGINECSFLAYHSLEYLCFFEDPKFLEFYRVVFIGEVVLAARRKIVKEMDDGNEFRVWRRTEILNVQAHQFFDDDGLDAVLAEHLMDCFSNVGCCHMAALDSPPKDEE